MQAFRDFSLACFIDCLITRIMIFVPTSTMTYSSTSAAHSWTNCHCAPVLQLTQGFTTLLLSVAVKHIMQSPPHTVVKNKLHKLWRQNYQKNLILPLSFFLLPELRTHFEPASETECGDKDADEVEESFQPSEQNGAEDTAITSGVSTLSFVVSHKAQQQLSQELGRLKHDTLR